MFFCLFWYPKKVDLGTEVELEKLFDSLDYDKTGYISYSEFLAGTVRVHMKLSEKKLLTAFQDLDVDGSGAITEQNLKTFTVRPPSDYLWVCSFVDVLGYFIIV